MQRERSLVRGQKGQHIMMLLLLLLFSNWTGYFTLPITLIDLETIQYLHLSLALSGSSLPLCRAFRPILPRIEILFIYSCTMGEYQASTTAASRWQLQPVPYLGCLSLYLLLTQLPLLLPLYFSCYSDFYSCCRMALALCCFHYCSWWKWRWRHYFKKLSFHGHQSQ